jgi:hypothetical protein
MQAIAETLLNLRIAEPQSFANMACFPLVSSSPRTGAPNYLLLDDALLQGSAVVTETSEGGSVPELRFENRDGHPVLLIDGEELVGARQNRILNLTILVAPHRTIVIPVSCVERGRWRYDSREFHSTSHSLYASARADKMAHVSSSLRSRGTRHADQAALWDSIDRKATVAHFESDTDAMADLFEHLRPVTRHYCDALHPVESQVGAVFAIDGAIVGLELFDHAETFRKLLPKIASSYALDAVEHEGTRQGAPTESAVADFVARAISAHADEYPAVGEGLDVRLHGEQLSGGALVVDHRLVHLAVFTNRARNHEGQDFFVMPDPFNWPRRRR